MVTESRHCMERSVGWQPVLIASKGLYGDKQAERGVGASRMSVTVTASVIFTHFAALIMQESFQLGPSGWRAAKRLGCDVCGLQRDCTNVIQSCVTSPLARKLT